MLILTETKVNVKTGLLLVIIPSKRLKHLLSLFEILLKSDSYQKGKSISKNRNYSDELS